MSADVSGSVFQEFSWLHGDRRNDRAAVFAARMKDLAFGVHKCLQLIESSEMARADGDTYAEAPSPLLNLYDTSVLFRLALTTAEIIGEQAEEFLVLAQARCDQAHAATSPKAEGGRHHG